MATVSPLTYARRAMNRNKTAWVDIRVAHMTRAHARFWDAYIQPDIRQQAANYLRTRSGSPRADRHWRWTGMRTLFPMGQRLQGRRCRALAILVQNADGDAVPAGMLLLIENYPWPVPGSAINKSVFTWFLSSAPDATLRALAVPDPPSLGRILVDTALVASKSLGWDGQMWLHAAPSGGPQLAHFYGTICHMAALPANSPLPGRRRSDGRHFYVTVSLADQLINGLQMTR